MWTLKHEFFVNSLTCLVLSVSTGWVVYSIMKGYVTREKPVQRHDKFDGSNYIVPDQYCTDYNNHGPCGSIGATHISENQVCVI